MKDPLEEIPEMVVVYYRTKGASNHSSVSDEFLSTFSDVKGHIAGFHYRGFNFRLEREGRNIAGSRVKIRVEEPEEAQIDRRCLSRYLKSPELCLADKSQKVKDRDLFSDPRIAEDSPNHFIIELGADRASGDVHEVYNDLWSRVIRPVFFCINMAYSSRPSQD